MGCGWAVSGLMEVVWFGEEVVFSGDRVIVGGPDECWFRAEDGLAEGGELAEWK